MVKRTCLWIALAGLLPAWQWEHPSPGSRFEAVSGNVAVGERGSIAVKRNGSWISAASGTVNDLHAVANSGTTIVAAGDAGTVVRSRDGVTWERSTSPGTASIVAIAATPKAIVIYGSDGTLATSTDDGVTFQSSGKDDRVSIPRAVAVASNGTIVVGGIAGLAIASGKFVTSEPIDRIALESDGSLLAHSASRVVYSPTQICNSCIDATYEVEALYRSTDRGATWQRKTVKDPTAKTFAWGPAVAPAPPASPPKSAVRGWSSVGPPTIQPDYFGDPQPIALPEVKSTIDARLFQLAATPSGRVFAVGTGGVFARDVNGAWSRRATPTGKEQRLNAIFALDEDHVIVVGDGGVIVTSADGGKTFRHAASDSTADLSAIWGQGNEVFAIGYNVTMRSHDRGATWDSTVTKVSGAHSLTGVSPNELYSIGSSIYKSTDGGATWASLPGNGGYAIFATPTDVIVVSFEGDIRQSTDHGKTWTKRASNTKETLGSITGAGDDFIATGSNSYEGVVVRSRDHGKTWTVDASIPTRKPMLSAVVVGKEIVLLGADNSILRGAR